MGKKNTGKDYEKLTQQVYQAFIDADCHEKGIRTITVEQNVQLKGISGNMHQIDVYWEFELAGTVYKTLVEVKDWKTPVKKEQIHSFKSLLEDVAGPTRGIFVSKSGFQEGAQTIAKMHGIDLVQISENEDQPTCRIHISHTTTHYIDVAVILDEDEYINNTKNGQRSRSLELMSKHTFTDLFLTSPQNKKVHLHDLVFKAAVPYYYSPALERHYVEKNLEEGWLWMSEDGVTEPIKISGYCFDCYNTQESTMLVVGFKDIAIYHVRDILKNKEHFYNAMKKEFVKANRSKIDREGLSNAGKTD